MFGPRFHHNFERSIFLFAQNLDKLQEYLSAIKAQVLLVRLAYLRMQVACLQQHKHRLDELELQKLDLFAQEYHDLGVVLGFGEGSLERDYYLGSLRKLS